MTFKPGQVTNPHGRPKKINIFSAEFQKFYKKHRLEIHKTGKILLKIANEEQKPWAIKQVMDTFYPKGGVYLPPEKTPNKQINVQINNLLNELPPEKQHLLWEALAESEKKSPALVSGESVQEEVIVEVESEPDSEGK